jgi:aspartate racemase
MKTIGVLGGMSSVASAEYYRRINEGINKHRGGHAAAEVVLYSVDFAVIEGFIRDEQWDQAARYLAERARRLQRAGAEFLVLATNTMHRVAEEVQHAIGIPLIHIVDPTADAATADGVNTVGLLGTAPVMEADFYRARFADLGFEVLVPAERDRAIVHRVIFEELTHGIVEDHSRQEYASTSEYR